MVQNPNSISGPKSEQTFRLSVTLSEEIYSSLERIARTKKVSMAWVIREAAEKYIGDEAPLFRGHGNG
jgi:metal-responsive CopG/Arc/MetJ family transcriptional regulator